MAAKWIWFFGDFELHHHKKISMLREERGHRYPTPWYLYDCNRQVRMRREVTLSAPEQVTFLFDGDGYVEAEGKRYAPGQSVVLDAGTHSLLVCVMNETGIPAIYADGDTVKTDEAWEATAFDGNWSAVGTSSLAVNPAVRPSDAELPTERVEPISYTDTDAGRIYDFGKETFIKLVFEGIPTGTSLGICYGESREEAEDAEFAVISDTLPAGRESSHTFPARACRYVRVSGGIVGRVYGLYEYLPFPIPCRFDSSDAEIRRIWEVAEYTFRLNSRMFYQDGIKRDRWVWSGDAYQSYFFNYYTYFDEEIIRRTIVALRGGDPIYKHTNTIVDYSLYWLCSIANHYKFTGDDKFLRQIYPRAKSMMEYCEKFENGRGFIEGREGVDWTFIDWSDMDKTGALAVMQMLYCRAAEALAYAAHAVGDTEAEKTQIKKAQRLARDIPAVYWNRDKGAFVTTVHGDTPSSEVRRHANIFAVLLGFADDGMKKSILENVLRNPDVPAITTPYFELYELEALCRLGEHRAVTEKMRAYWGGMLREGATTFWEEYDPTLPGKEQLGMYGWKFDKSLCHAWGAGPVYLLGRYYAGVEPASDGYATFTVSPVGGGLADYDITVPVKDGTVRVKLTPDGVTVTASRTGGVLVYGGGTVTLPAGVPVTLDNRK